MAPTIQNNTAQEKRPQRPVEKRLVHLVQGLYEYDCQLKRNALLMFIYRSDLVCKVKYCNMLPDIPFDLKFLAYPFNASR